MDNKQAIEILKTHNEKCSGCDKLCDDLCKPAVKMAIKALEKQIPEKITHEATIYKCCTCPSCKNVVDEFETIGDSRARVTFQFCHFCGQALDWNS